MNVNERIARVLGVRTDQVDAAVELLDAGNTVPFIARYRKETTGNLTDEHLRQLSEELDRLRKLDKRKEEVSRLIDEQGKLTEEIKSAIEGAETLSTLEDIYLPFRPKRRTRASAAIERGLEPLADRMMEQVLTEEELRSEAEAFVDEEAGVADSEEALRGAMDILAQRIAEDARVRASVREEVRQNGAIRSVKKGEDDGEVYRMYYDFAERIRHLKPHRVLALNRGEKEGVLRVSLETEEEKLLRRIAFFYRVAGGQGFSYVEAAIADGFSRLLFPSIATEVRAELTAQAQEKSAKVFASNLSAILMQRPMKDSVILGMDPGYRTGCKLAVIDATGRVLATGTAFLTMSEARKAEAKQTILSMIESHEVNLIAVGNGTASRETLDFVVELLPEISRPVHYAVVNEAGASIYSASALAAAELPEMDVSLRGAVSIARRLLDPLAELVKIEPEHIGVGQYQHDLPKKELSERLSAVVEDCVNAVGVNINTASVPLLSYVAGLTKTTAGSIVARVAEEGPFRSRTEIKQVKGLGPKTFEQCAGFLRIPGGEDPLDNTGVHPESYSAARELMKEDLEKIDVAEAAKALSIGEPTCRDIIEELRKPGRDPRESMPPPLLRADVLSIEDLKEGMELWGTVRNVVDFGCFVDIGIKNDGLIHVSELADRFVSRPEDVVSVGQVLKVRVLSVDVERGRVGLTRKGLESAEGKNNKKKETR